MSVNRLIDKMWNIHPKEYYSALKRNEIRDFPGGPMVKNLPSNAGDVGLIPGQGTKIPHATGQLSSAL